MHQQLATIAIPENTASSVKRVNIRERTTKSASPYPTFPIPTCGATTGVSLLEHTTTVFQSTPPRGGRPVRFTRAALCKDVSIHAPTRGATHRRCTTGTNCQRFNPRPHAGGDLLVRAVAFRVVQFQSTPPRGGRREALELSLTAAEFQSTPPRGGRRDGKQHTLRKWSVSIHAPTRGATAESAQVHVSYSVSIHAPTRGATRRPCGQFARS